MKWSPKGKYFDLLKNSVNLFLGKYMEISLDDLFVDIGA